MEVDTGQLPSDVGSSAAPQSLQSSGGRSASCWEPQPSCHQYCPHRPMSCQSVQSSTWRVLYVVSPPTIPPPAASIWPGWSLHRRPFPVLLLVCRRFSAPWETSYFFAEQREEVAVCPSAQEFFKFQFCPTASQAFPQCLALRLYCV